MFLYERQGLTHTWIDGNTPYIVPYIQLKYGSMKCLFVKDYIHAIYSKIELDRQLFLTSYFHTSTIIPYFR